jgi:hypothetical protein
MSFWYGFGGQGGTGSGDTVLGEWEVWTGGSFLGPCSAWNTFYRQGRIGNPCGDLHFWSLHPGGANFLFAAGAGRFLAYSAGVIDRSGSEPASVMHSLATRAGGEVVGLP